MRRYEGKVAVVTGAAAGLGRALALGYAGEGAELVVLDIAADGLDETAAMIRERGQRCTTYRIDFSQEDQIVAVGAQICAAFPTIDVLYNNAGLAYGEVNTRIDEVSMARWQYFLAVNTLAPVFFTKALKAPLAAAEGCVINQSSMAAYQPGVIYSSTKSALNQMTYGLARLYGPDGIRVNAIAPGLMETPASSAALPEEHRSSLQQGQMLKLHGTADDIVKAGLFLASDDARFITGEVLHVDAGHHLRGWRE